MPMDNIMRVDAPTVLLAVTTSASISAQFNQTSEFVVISNIGTNPAFVSIGATYVAAAVPTATPSNNGTPVPAGAIVTYEMVKGAAPNFYSAISTGGTTTLTFQYGNGI